MNIFWMVGMASVFSHQSSIEKAGVQIQKEIELSTKIYLKNGNWLTKC